MAIDGIITNVFWEEDGTATLDISPRAEGQLTQRRLACLNPPRHLEAAIGTEIWSQGARVFVGETHWADRVGLYGIRLVPSKRKGV